VPARSTPVIWSGGCKSHNQQAGWHRYCLNATDYNYAQSHFTIDKNGRFNIKTSGFYRMKFFTIQHGCGQQNLSVRVNGSDKAYHHENAFSKAQGWRPRTIHYTGPVKAGDYIEAWAYHDGCGNQYAWHAWGGNGAHSRVTLEYIGPLPE